MPEITHDILRETPNQYKSNLTRLSMGRTVGSTEAQTWLLTYHRAIDERVR